MYPLFAKREEGGREGERVRGGFGEKNNIRPQNQTDGWKRGRQEGPRETAGVKESTDQTSIK